MKQPFVTYLLFVLFLLGYSCKQGPKVITANEDTETKPQSSGIFDGDSHEHEVHDTGSSSASTGFMESLHSVVVNKTIPADKYIYINVTENNKSFWIASRQQDITIGETYFYKDALLKTNFESKAHQKVFDTIYLVSNLVPKVHGGNQLMAETNTFETKASHNHSEAEIESTDTQTRSHQNTLTIAKLVDNVEAYENKIVEITGKIIKVNPNIMDRNWYHLQDGSKDDFDFVVTSNTYIPEGHTITVKAVVHRNVDFGAGYRYDLILENGQLVKH